MNSHRIPKPDVSILAAICILLFWLEAAVLNYEHVYKATPDYSVRVLNRAIQSDDEETVTALVDDKAIAAGLFDGMASRGGGIDSLPVLQLAWAPLRDDFITDSSRLFHLTMQKEKDDADRAGAAENVRLRLQALGFPFPVSGWHYVSSRYAHKTDSSHAHMTVTLYNERLDRNLTCTIELTRTGPKQWRITGLADAPAFISEINDAWDQRLAAYNRPIQRQLDGLIKIRNVSATLVKGSNHQTFLRITYTPVFEGKPEEITRNITVPENININIVCKAWKKGNVCSLSVDGDDYSVNGRGINIIVYDPIGHRLVDSICFDAHGVPAKFYR